MPCIVCIQEMCKSSSSSSDQKVIQQSSEIEMLNTKLETLRKQHMQLIDIHSKCKTKKSDDQVRHSVYITTHKWDHIHVLYAYVATYGAAYLFCVKIN